MSEILITDSKIAPKQKFKVGDIVFLPSGNCKSSGYYKVVECIKEKCRIQALLIRPLRGDLKTIKNASKNTVPIHQQHLIKTTAKTLKADADALRELATKIEDLK
jgi:hypothetical protein